MIYLLGEECDTNPPTLRFERLPSCRGIPTGHRLGGIGTYHYTLARGLVDLGCSVVIVAPRNRWTHELGRHPLV